MELAYTVGFQPRAETPDVEVLRGIDLSVTPARRSASWVRTAAARPLFCAVSRAYFCGTSGTDQDAAHAWLGHVLRHAANNFALAGQGPTSEYDDLVDRRQSA